ncbi:Crp/Fnr family transcriptional regulator [Pontitalea aquivivens]|uniref:Crp/Fnr family transcriptional regulator n=1 Tax=Pontitalea aquivivens TaxID=3388663 RepID=UPI0039710F4B
MQDRFVGTARGAAVLRSLPPAVRDGLLARARVRAYDRGATIFLQGERARALRIVVAGWIKLYRIAPNGSEAILQLLPAGCSFEELPVLMGAPHKASAQAVSPCQILLIDAEVLQQAGCLCPDVAMAVLRATSAHVDDMFGQVEQLKVQNGAQRLAEFLADLCPPESLTHEVLLPFEKTLVAGRLGMKPESLSRAFGRLNRLGVRVRHQNVSIRSVPALRSYALADPADAWTGPR